MLTTRTLRIGEAELRCNEVAGDGRPLLLLHGLTGHRDDFRERMPELADLGRLLAPDVRGHGDFSRSTEAKGFAFSQLVEDLREVFDALEIERCDLLGHSFGGMIALRFALAHPERLASLVLMNTSPFVPDGYSRDALDKGGAIARARGMTFLQEVVEKATRASGPAEEAEMAAKWGGDGYWEHHRMRYGAMDPVAYGPLGLCMMDQVPVDDRLGEIACPTTVIIGDRDLGFLRAADVFEARIPGVVRVTLEDAGHHPHMEEPAAWSAAVRDHVVRARS